MSVPAPPDDPVITSIRANIVFENMIVSVLTVTAIAGAAHAVIGLGGSLVAGHMGLGAVGASALGAATFALLFFFAAFGVAVALGVPLFLRLEKLKVRKAWPYAALSAVAGFFVLAAFGIAPAFEAPLRALYLAPGVAAAILFARKMEPFWRAAERADAARDVAVARLH